MALARKRSALWAVRTCRALWPKEKAHCVIQFRDTDNMNAEKICIVARPHPWQNDVSYVHFIGSDYLKVEWSARRKVFEIASAFLRAGYSFILRARIDVQLTPAALQGAVLTAAQLEHSAIEEMRQVERKYRSVVKLAMETTPYVWFKESAWATPEGKQFVKEMRQKFLIRWDSDSEQETLSDTEEDAAAAAAEDDHLCCICFEKPPDTIVHPCLHCVVCAACSIRLRKTADKALCVQCRRPIGFIDEPV